MLIVKEVQVYGSLFPVLISDDRTALQAAYAAGRAVVGLWRRPEDEKEKPGEEAACPDLSPALYIVEKEEDADEGLLTKAVCRRFHMPVPIGETKRLLIREFQASDCIPEEEQEFADREILSSYVACQYPFYEWGLWALQEKETGRIIGKAGITDGELGYHIYSPYRRQGFACEACKEIIDFAWRQGVEQLTLQAEEKNEPSIRLAEKLGFERIGKKEGRLLFSLSR